MKINTNSNVYIITYSVVMVVIVAVLLTLAAVGLKPMQDENILNDNKKQIAKTLSKDPESVSFDDYNKLVEKAILIDTLGVEIKECKEEDVFNALKNVENPRKDGAAALSLFVAKDGRVVIPLRGKGLWDDIWGFVALDSDMNTIKGIVLDHKGETPGLGAEIATKDHQDKYVDKTIFKGNKLVGITLVKGGVKKESKNLAHEVDAITGGTKTSKGVENMIKDCLKWYQPYLTAAKAAVVAAQETTSECECAEGKTNDLN